MAKPAIPVCGAITRQGSACQNTLVTGCGRCPVHAAQLRVGKAIAKSKKTHSSSNHALAPPTSTLSASAVLDHHQLVPANISATNTHNKKNKSSTSPTITTATNTMRVSSSSATTASHSLLDQENTTPNTLPPHQPPSVHKKDVPSFSPLSPVTPESTQPQFGVYSQTPTSTAQTIHYDVSDAMSSSLQDQFVDSCTALSAVPMTTMTTSTTTAQPECNPSQSPVSSHELLIMAPDAYIDVGLPLDMGTDAGSRMPFAFL